ncbi:MAG: thioredoxin [Paludibacteraceae bacterium]|nr:thioredoxin [Paludibacteraceae bacterium]
MEIKFNDENYNEYINQKNKLVVIDFWASWCGPCQRLKPVIEQVAEEYTDKAFIGKYNTENNEELIEKFNIRNIPTILFIKNGEVVDRLTGAVNKTIITETIDKHL